MILRCGRREREGNILLLLIVFNLCITNVRCEPVSAMIAFGSAVAAFAGWSFSDKIKCQFYECCDDKEIKVDIDGGGKNYVSSMIAEHMYKRGMNSRFVHVFVSTLHFPHVDKIDRYKDQLQQWIRGNTTECQRSLFIFDEVDKMHGGVLEAIIPFLDYHEKLDGIDFRRSVFVFLSNTGGDDISAHALAEYLKGNRREAITLGDMERVISRAAYNEKGGLQYSSLIKNHQIDHQIPFLPLTRTEVMLCARDYIRQRPYSYPASHDPQVDNQRRVADMLQYFPDTEQLYSTSGCKKVPNKVELLLQELEDEQAYEQQQANDRKGLVEL